MDNLDTLGESATGTLATENRDIEGRVVEESMQDCRSKVSSSLPKSA